MAPMRSGPQAPYASPTVASMLAPQVGGLQPPQDFRLRSIYDRMGR
jgi:hypothetical protein